MIRLVLSAAVLLVILAGVPGPVAAQEGPSDTPLDFGEMWENFYVFVTIAVVFVGALGAMARSMTMASYGAFLAFAHIAIGTGNGLLENILTASLVLIFIALSFKLWRFEGAGG